ncbi:hypothetical protein QFC19_004824 [Naganishia cerealis]|uniref:Uncharacterized protein n=1 Tax=Naganishia cerealis TaxID=610337 RepID=A0ACC2VT21_9TREE|nr:hypothetical protein QFC19_004824 [Naganishia cerealis]
MKAVFSKLRSKDAQEDKNKGKENNGPSHVRKLAHGFGSLSRTTGGKAFQSRQSSGSYPVEAQRTSTGSDKNIRPTYVNLLPSPNTPIFDRSTSLYVPTDTPRSVTPINNLVTSSVETSLYDLEQENTSSSGKAYPLQPSIVETSISTEATPTQDTEKPFTPASTNDTAGKSFAQRWLRRTSQTRSTSENSHRTIPDLLHRKDSGSSSLSSRFGSRSRSEVDLVANLSAEERTRQEVLFEIVSSEERYVLDLIKMKETFIDKLIPLPADDRVSLLPDRLSKTRSRQSESSSSLISPRQEFSKLGSRSVSYSSASGENLDHLPIAAHFAASRSATPMGGAQHGSGNDQPSSPPRFKHTEEEDLDATIRIKRTYHHLSRGQSAAKELDEPIDYNIRAHKSLPPLPLPPPPLHTRIYPAARERMSLRPPSGQALTSRDSAQSLSPPDQPSRRFSANRKSASALSLPPATANFHSIHLPEDLQIVLRVIRDSILKGHIALSDALRKRYDDQYPLVRGLADIFIEHSHVFQEYSKFVIHLERAIQQLDDCQAALESNKKRQNDSTIQSLAAAGAAILALNQTADDKGETGLAISLSKPFQRLLKYPLLFQNLLYNTDATLSEYDSCISLLNEVDGIVRSLEDEKANEDVREKTRDTLARIEGLERDATLSFPRPTRVSISERPAADVTHSIVASDNANRRSLRRLSDLMRGNDQIELWEVTFSDVTLICQKIGSTSLPVYSRVGRGNDEGRIHVKSKAMRSVRRSRQIEPRNLYNFVSVKEWHTVAQDTTKDYSVNSKPALQSRIFCRPESRRSVSGDWAMSHSESIKEESSEESDSDDSEQMDFILGAAAPRRRVSTRPVSTSNDTPSQVPNLPDSPKKDPTAVRTTRVSSRANSKGTLPMRARSPTEMINSQAKFGTRLRNPELSISTNGRSSTLSRPIGHSSSMKEDVSLPRTSQRAVSTPVNAISRGSTRLPPSSVRGTRRQF